ncbi:DUF1674 domain-containing protein [Phyllobacterium sp. OV277]|uniref:DUF1674 domain-containing protein n=1 Tax=Phyllobacterium sp. OV277 TaxID=1882772 RepID=UPI00088BE2BE|nr:DUF1674 domain-containing protein [Phyllobacterium sp. OV277]SDO68302.1 hypothetical protein SAMN05443582_102791 [Phyllobacterium sp. OV277]
MTSNQTSGTPQADNTDQTSRKPFDQLPPAAQRALLEAEARHKADQEQASQPREIGGRGGKDPARFGDWEIKGRTIDF